MYAKRFARLEFEQTPVYIDPEGPEWFVPNRAGDRLLLQKEETLRSTHGTAPEMLAAGRFLAVLPESGAPPYPGRSGILELSHLDECWLHITDRCNLACAHCLFSCSPGTGKTLDTGRISKTVKQAFDAGAKTFFLTGGEPLIHPDFKKICRLILEGFPDTNLVILTNGLFLPEFAEFFRSLPADRLFVQISMDGLQDSHDKIRGKGSFKKLTEALGAAADQSCFKTLAMAAGASNAGQMADTVRLASDYGISNVHFLWMLPAGKAAKKNTAQTETLFANLRLAAAAAQSAGVTIDNIKTMEARVFSPANTRHDLGSAGWRSLAVGPGGTVYPTAAMVGSREAACGHVDSGLADVWKNSPLLEHLRGLSVADIPGCKDDPLRFIIGGGDIDQSFFHSKAFAGGDPCVPLYRKTALWLISRAADRPAAGSHPQIRLRMGDIVKHCHMDGPGVALVHSNCVLTFPDPHGIAGDFYSEAALNENREIENPVCYPESLIDHIPKSARTRSYGCGSPVADAGVQAGQTVVDLGSGAGMECFIASRQTGPEGRVLGIDMLDHMKDRAEKLKPRVCSSLGYDNIRFLKGFLEDIPLPDNSADVVISNCVINLSEDKRRTFSEIFRILKPGGRMVVADVVCDRPVPPAIAGNEKLRGQCLAGAMLQPYLVSMLEACGFADIKLEKRFFYRQAEGHSFFSLTYSAFRPEKHQETTLVYPGPFAAVITDDGKILHRGHPARHRLISGSSALSRVRVMDELGNFAGQQENSGCGCGPPPARRHTEGCMVCGRPLAYPEDGDFKTCSFCFRVFQADAVCTEGHFVCDACHGQDALEIIRHICITTDRTGMAGIADTIRAHPSMPVHGPEHHYMVPGVILAAYRNSGGTIPDDAIMTGIERGKTIPGGTCAFWGCCGAAAGAGIALSIILGANPLIPDKRKKIQQAAAEITAQISLTEAARCCRRETLTVLEKTAEISKRLLYTPLDAGEFADCEQADKNKDCIQAACQYFRVNRTAAAGKLAK